MISVAMTSYNGALYIEEQIQSILNQTVRIDELVICDDCSTDNTVKVIERFNDARIRLYRNVNNLGYIKNFYKAIELTKGEYIFLSDQDDVWEKDKIEKVLATMINKKAELVCTNFTPIDSEGEIIKEQLFRPNVAAYQENSVTKIDFLKLLYGNVAQGCTYCFTDRVKKIYLQLKCDEIFHDYQLMLIGAALGKAYYQNEKLIRYRIHNKNAVGFSRKNNLQHIKIRFPKLRPKTSTFLKKLKGAIIVPHYYYGQLIIFLRAPVWKAIFNKIINN